jgi:hypothetical protein
MVTQTMAERPSIFFFKIGNLTRSWPLDWRVCFGKGIKWDGPSSFGLWAWPLEALHHAGLKAPISIFYWLFSAHFFGLLTKFSHSIPWPLAFDGHSLKRPLHGRGKYGK